MKGRKCFITDRPAYYRDYYQKHKLEYLDRYRSKKLQNQHEAVMKDYYMSYYKQLATHLREPLESHT